MNFRHVSGKTIRNVRLQEVRGDSVIVEKSGSTLGLPIDSLVWIETRSTKPVSGLYIPVGIAGGAFVGYLVGSLVEDDTPTDLENHLPPTIIGPIIGGVAGGVAGGLIASGKNMDRTDLKEMDRGERTRMLDSLLVAADSSGSDVPQPVVQEVLSHPSPDTSNIQYGPWLRFAIKAGLSSPVSDFGSTSTSQAGY